MRESLKTQVERCRAKWAASETTVIDSDVGRLQDLLFVRPLQP